MSEQVRDTARPKMTGENNFVIACWLVLGTRQAGRQADDQFVFSVLYDPAVLCRGQQISGSVNWSETGVI
jgi:hypothetical protein